MKRYHKYKDGVEYILTDEGICAKLIIKKDKYKIEIKHSDIGFLYETREYHVENFRRLIEKQEIFVLNKMMEEL